MDEDGVESEPKKFKPKSEGECKDPDDLAEYDLDNYDEENTGAGKILCHSL
jgi:hypothetical protein